MAAYPAVGFHFVVHIEVGGATATDTRFQEVRGISQELQVKEVKEGGENRFSHKLPTRASYPNLVLKRGLFTDSGVIEWVRKAIEDMDIEPASVSISLMNEEHEPLHTYNFVNCWPTKWEVSEFNAEESKAAVETLELAYQYFKVEGGGGDLGLAP